jgi:hypothetical protein
VFKKHLNPYCPYDDPLPEEKEEGCADETHPQLPFLMAA